VRHGSPPLPSGTLAPGSLTFCCERDHQRRRGREASPRRSHSTTPSSAHRLIAGYRHHAGAAPLSRRRRRPPPRAPPATARPGTWPPSTSSSLASLSPCLGEREGGGGRPSTGVLWTTRMVDGGLQEAWWPTRSRRSPPFRRAGAGRRGIGGGFGDGSSSLPARLVGWRQGCWPTTVEEEGDFPLSPLTCGSH
jgi:hypothetical protein